MSLISMIFMGVMLVSCALMVYKRAIKGIVIVFTLLSYGMFIFAKDLYSSENPFFWYLLSLFFQNYKKCYLCSCISLLFAHLCVITLIDLSIAPKLQFLIYLFFANFCFFFLCFGRFEAFKTTFFISLFATLLTFIPSWIDFTNTRNVLIGYLILYVVLYFLAFLFASGRLIACLIRICITNFIPKDKQ